MVHNNLKKTSASKKCLSAFLSNLPMWCIKQETNTLLRFQMVLYSWILYKYYRSLQIDVLRFGSTNSSFSIDVPFLINFHEMSQLINERLRALFMGNRPIQVSELPRNWSSCNRKHSGHKTNFLKIVIEANQLLLHHFMRKRNIVWKKQHECLIVILLGLVYWTWRNGTALICLLHMLLFMGI